MTANAPAAESATNATSTKAKFATTAANV